MDKKELKKILKPMIKECIHEILLSEGILSGIISEIAKGLGTDLNERQAPRRQSKPKPKPRSNSKSAKNVNETFRNRMREIRPNNKVKETKRSLLEAINKDAYGGVDLFEGTEPLRSGGGSSQPQGALSGVDPTDAGIDISGIMEVANRDWSKLI